MPDVYATITGADPAVVDQLASILEVRAADEQQRGIREAYLAGLELPDGAHVVEVGCGTGAVTRWLANRPGVGAVVGVDPSPVFLARARELARDISNLSFVEGDGRALPIDADVVDLLVFHTTLCHIPEPERALAEAFRVLRPGGRLAILDGDYSTVSCALGTQDPLQACLDASVAFLVHDPWFVRKMPRLVTDAGFGVDSLRGHSYVDGPAAGPYMLSLIDLGADLLVANVRIGRGPADALKAEARRRSDAGQFFGHINYVSLIARKTG